jgi:hypothetical protein
MSSVMPTATTAAIESRVSKVEAHIDALAEQMHGLSEGMLELTKTVRMQGDSLSQQVQSLAIQTTNAQAAATAPRRTDWGVLIGGGGLLVSIVIAIGGMAIVPLQMRTSDAHFRLDRIDTKVDDEIKLPIKPVVEVRMNTMEALLREKQVQNTEAIKDLDIKLQKEFSLVNGTIKDRVAELQKTYDEVRINGSNITRERLAVIETLIKRNTEEIKELRTKAEMK